MSSFQSIQELIRGLQKGSALLNDMFLKRKAIAIKYDDALEALGGDENRLQFLIQNEILCQIGNKLELEEIYLRFFACAVGNYRNTAERFPILKEVSTPFSLTR